MGGQSGMIGGMIGGGLGAASSGLGDYEEAGNLLDDASFYTEEAIRARIAGIDKMRIRKQRIEKESGEAIAKTAKSGVDQSGTPMTVLFEILKRGEEDLGAIKRGADAQAGNLQAKSRAARHQARYLRNTYVLRMLGSFFSGGGGSALTAGQRTGERKETGQYDIPESEKLGPGDASEGLAPTKDY